MMRSAWISISASITLAACGTAAPSGAPASPAPSSVATSPAPKATGTTQPQEAAPKLCGCSLCAPLVSDDSCTTDADCAPSTPCHAAACVAKAKAQPKSPDTMCTMMMSCQSADANRCGCHQGRCALVPREENRGG